MPNRWYLSNVVLSKTAHLNPHTEFLWSREDYEDLIRRGVFGPEDQVELLNGKLITMAPQFAPHATACTLLNNILTRVCPDGHFVRCQLPIALDERSELEPDLAVVKGAPRDYADRHPAANDVVLVVEVADSSLDYDRRKKLPAYALAGIPEYWIVNLTDRTVGQYSNPKGDGYGRRDVLNSTDLLKSARFACEDTRIADFLP